MSLTPRAVAFAALVAALGIIGTWNPNVFQGAWKIGLAVLAVGLIYEWVFVARNWPTLEIEDGQAVKLGRDTNIALHFRNTGARQLSMRYAPALPELLTGSRDNRDIEIAPGSTVDDEVRVRPVRLGTGEWPQLPAMIRGPLGLADWPGKLRPAASLSVIPDTLGERAIRIASIEKGGNARILAGSGMELHHLRPYRRGDPPRAVDWKATARSGKLTTRVFSEDQHLEIIICLDAGRTSRLEMDGMAQISHYVNLAARFAEYVTIAEDRVGLVVFSDRIRHIVPPQRGERGVRGIRDTLVGLEPELAESDLVRAALEVGRLARHRSLVVLLTSLYDRGASAQLKRFAGALMPKHLPIVVGTLSEEVSALAETPAQGWFDPYRSLAAQEYRRDLQGNAAMLTRMGAYTVASRPSELDQRVLGLYDRLRSQHRV